MENQHRKIIGYRELTQQEIDLIHRIKLLAGKAVDLCDDVKNHPDSRNRDASIARTQIETGFMWLIRAVARPEV